MTSHYEERLQRDLDWIKELIEMVGQELTQAIGNAVKSALTLDRDLAGMTIVGDYTINRQTRELDRLCHAFVARHLPTAGHLRYVSSVLRLNIELERIGDYAATISRTAAQLSAPPPPAIARDIEVMAEQAGRLLTDALQSFQRRDVQQAQATMTAAARSARYSDRVFTDLANEGDAHNRPTRDLFSLMATLNRLERVISQAKNICEEAVFVVTGQTKAAKVFDILFVDSANNGASQLAEHFSRKAFPDSGRYSSAGWQPAEEIDPPYQDFAETVGLDLTKAWPTDLATLDERLDWFYLIIGLDPDTRTHLPKVPFHTASIVWDLGGATDPEAVYQQLTPRIRELMETLRGEQAS